MATRGHSTPPACLSCLPQANKELAEPLQKAQAELAELQSQLADYQKDKQSLAATKSRLGGAEKQARGEGGRGASTDSQDRSSGQIALQAGVHGAGWDVL
jgi:hypothetical protein